MLIKKRGRKPRRTTEPFVKSGSPYGKLKVVSSESQNIKPNERKTFRKNTIRKIAG